MDAALNGFLNELMIAETGIDHTKAEWYEANLDSAFAPSWRVEKPGRIWRDRVTGEPIRELVTIRESFRRLGIHDVKRPFGPEAMRRWRYSVINGWGFVGYQLGEALLIETGHYEPVRARCLAPDGTWKRLASYYSGDLASQCWRDGCRERHHRPYGRELEILATDVNRWCGTFTGKDGARSFASLTTPEVQDAVFFTVLRHNLAKIRNSTERAGWALADAIRRRSQAESHAFTLSGCLAAAHLCGAEGAAEYLLSGRTACDETGTDLRSYFKRFSGYSIEDWCETE